MATDQPGFWKTEAGKEAHQRLEAWGTKRLEERMAGSIALSSTTGGGGRGKPGDMPAIFHAAMDVDQSLVEWGGSSNLMSLLEFLFADKGQDLDSYEDVELDKFMLVYYPRRQRKNWWRCRRRYLNNVVRDFAEFMAYKRGLGEHRKPDAPAPVQPKHVTPQAKQVQG